MQKSQKIGLIIAISAIVISGIALLVVQKKSLERSLVDVAILHEYERAKNIVLQSNLILSAQSTGETIDGKLSLTNVKNEKYTTAEIFSGKTPTLVFRYSPQGCSPCINATFEHLRRLKDSVDSNKLKIAIIPNNMELRQMVVEKAQSVKNQFSFYLAD